MRVRRRLRLRLRADVPPVKTGGVPIFYSFSDTWKVGVQTTNLLNTRTELLVSSDVTDPEGFRQKYSWTDTDRRIAFVVRATY